jgi:acyl-CoA hydrolase
MRMEVKGKTPAETRIEVAQIMVPMDANSIGKVHGGTIMKLIDSVAGIVASRHARSVVVTASIDRLDFISPASVGELIILRANLNYVGRTSMEVGVRVDAENLLTGDHRYVASAYLTMVAIDRKGKPKAVPPLVPESEEDLRRFREGEKRKQERLKSKLEKVILKQHRSQQSLI